jgi:SNF2 family DNA or RNA helicase
MVDLMPYQANGSEFLRAHPRSYLADDAGLGKTRQVLASLDGPLLVVTTAAIRDADVWGGEARRIGWDAPLTVVSYNGLDRYLKLNNTPPTNIVFDEAHRLKNRKVSWYRPAQHVVKNAERVHLLSGTPIPNQASELWSQLALLRKMPAYWPWVRDWFTIEAAPWSAHVVTNKLKYCGTWCAGRTCVHWQEFHDLNLAGYWLRRERDQVLTDLPPLTGHEVPMLTPMTRVQRKAYAEMKKSYLAELPGGVRVSALTQSQRFINLWRLSTSVECAFPGTGLPLSDDSTKLMLIREMLETRTRPVFIVHWFGNTGRSIGALLTDLGVSWAGVNGTTPQAQRRAIFADFQAGNYAVLVGSVGVVAEGITLTAADEAVLVERSWVPSQNEQVIRRLHRIGQTRPVSVRQLVTPKSVDTLQWETLTKKQAGIDPVLTPKDLAKML